MSHASVVFQGANPCGSVSLAAFLFLPKAWVEKVSLDEFKSWLKDLIKVCAGEKYLLKV